MGIITWEKGSPISEAHVFYDKGAGEVRFNFFQDTGLPFELGEEGALAKLKANLESLGFTPGLTRIRPQDQLHLEVTCRDNEHKGKLKEFAAQHSKDLSRAKVYCYDKEDDPLAVEVKTAGFSRTDFAKFKKLLEEKGYKSARETNEYKIPFIQVTLPESDPLLQGMVNSEITAEQFAMKLVNGSGLSKGVGTPPFRDPNPIKQKLNEIQQWRKENPFQATGRIYLPANMGQFLSGVVRGNFGEAMMGIFWFLSNLDMGLGPRKRRSEKKLVEDIIQDFKTKEGKIDFDKSEDFISGDGKYGTLVADYLNWREKSGNDVSSKAILAIMAGFSAFMGSLKGQKTRVLDEEGNVKLGADGKPEFRYVKDPALMYDGSAAMAAYLPQVVFVPPKTSYNTPLINAEAISKPVLNGLKEIKHPAVQKIVAGYNKIESNPPKTTGDIMGTRNILHMLVAGYQILREIPAQLQAYKNKLVVDAVRTLTDEGGERSYYGEMKSAFGIDKFVDVDGNLTKQAIDAKNTFTKEYEAKQEEKSALEAKIKKTKKPEEAASLKQGLDPLNSYLQDNGRKYELALLIGCFDKDDKSKNTGIPLINRKTIPGSYQKLINRHEAKLKDPYNVTLEKGGNEEFMYKMALNRTFFEETKKSQINPWLRMYYSVFNFTAANQMKKGNKAERPRANQAALQVDQTLFFKEAATHIVEELDKQHGDENSKERREAQQRAIHNFAVNASDERELVASRLSVKEIEDGIGFAINGKIPVRAKKAAEQLGIEVKQSAPIGNVRAVMPAEA